MQRKKWNGHNKVAMAGVRHGHRASLPNQPSGKALGSTSVVEGLHAVQKENYAQGMEVPA
eukprot:scaffold22580_cov210-Cylindrotheca_fusiformis.AAC.2